MRFASATATGLWSIFLHPFLAGANVFQTSQQQTAASDGSIVPQAAALAQTQQEATAPQFQFPLHQGDDSYLIVVNGLPFIGRAGTCSPESLTNTTVNGQRLQYFPAGLHRKDGQDIRASLYGSVVVTDRQNHEPHTVTLFVDAVCGDEPLGTSEPHDIPGHPTKTLEITIADIDQVPWREEGFQTDREVNGVETVKFIVRGPQVWPALEWDETPVTTDEFDPAELADTAIEEEISKLRALQDELRAIQHSVEQQRVIVNNLEKDAYRHSEKHLNDCKGVTCVLKTLYHKGKNCIHLAYLHLKEAGLASSPPYCHEMYSVPESSRAKVFMSSNSKCSGRYCGHRGKAAPSSDNYTPLLADVKEDDYSPSGGPFPDNFEARRHSAQYEIYHGFAILASILCLGCLTAVLHRRCCNPRARADRAARREERRTRREYRCAARKRVWREWWERQPWSFGQWRNSSLKRIQDYEEKRALILQQEAVLECAMQHEISILQNSGQPGVMRQVMTMAEEGRLSHVSPSMPSRLVGESTGSEALPAYRSRSSSGRPPSYNEFDENAVANGFMDYTPSGSTNDDVNSLRSFASGITPESSVVELSPRQSSETLRTERSAL